MANTDQLSTDITALVAAMNDYISKVTAAIATAQAAGAAESQAAIDTLDTTVQAAGATLAAASTALSTPTVVVPPAGGGRHR